MAQADPPKEACAVEKINQQSLPLPLNKVALYFKEWTTAGGVLK